MEIKTNNDIAIFFWDSWISVAPTIINIANSFGEKGHKVFIFIRDVNEVFAPETKLNENVLVIKISRSLVMRIGLKLINRVLFIRIWFNSKFLDRVILYDITRQSRKFFRKKIRGYDCVGVDSIGLVWASDHLKSNSILYYLSLELLCKEVIADNNYFLKWIKNKEILIHKNKVRMTIIQDKFRLHILERENAISLDGKYSILTNSPRESKVQKLKDASYFNKKFGLNQDVKKILMAGIVDEESMSSSLAKAFGGFRNKNIKLIFHERKLRDPREQYFDKLRNGGGENFYLSLKPLPYSDIHKIYDSADIGLVFYDTSFGDNFSYIIGASGKLSHYLKHGIPVVSNNLPGFKELFEKYNIGFVLDDVNDLEAAVNKIFLNYKIYSENAYKCYSSEYNFDLQFESFYSNYLRHLN